MKEKQDRMRELQNKKDAEFKARQLIMKVSRFCHCCLFALCFSL